MNETLLKSEMMRLWKETFHDTDDYINLVFDNYFSPENVVYHTDDDGNPVAAILGVPYVFGGFDSEKCCGKLRGLYLCGLMIKPEFRHQDIMSDMIQEMNISAEARGFDFTFLIPADEGLVKFYFDRGYVDAFYRLCYNYSFAHDFKRELTSVDEKSVEVFDRLKIDILSAYDVVSINKIIDYIIRKEETESVVSLIHSRKDIEIAIAECFLKGGKICVAKDEYNDIFGVAFYRRNDENNIDADYILYSNIGAKYKLCNAIKSENNDCEMSLFESAEIAQKSNQALWKPFYIGAKYELPKSNTIDEVEVDADIKSMSKPYGMIRLLNVDHVVKYTADVNHFLVGENPASLTDDMLSYKKCGIKTLEEFLFRHPHEDDVIYTLLNFPRLPLRMGLLLD